MSQNPNPYESTSYGSNQPGGSSPNYNSPYEQYEPTLPASGNNVGGYEPTQRAPGSNPNANVYPPPPYGQPPAGQGSSPSYPPYVPPQPNNPYQYQNQGTPPPPAYTPGQYAPPPQYVPPSAPSPGPRRRSSGRLIALIAVAVLVILAGIIAAIAIPLHNTQVANDNATATAQTQGTAQAHSNATATANANATATAVANTYPFSANVKLDDPLSDNSKGQGWITSANCSFSGGAYHAVESNNNTYATCVATKSNFSDFTYQVTMQITKGTYGGITFRGDDANGKNYTFVLGQDGSYDLFLYSGSTPSSSNPKQLKTGTAASFNTGNGQSNDIGVVARGSSIALYVNKQEVTTVTDSTYSRGQIGMVVYDTGSAVESVYSNAKLWQL